MDLQDTGASGALLTRVSGVQGNSVQNSTVQYSTVQCSTVQYSTVQYSTVQYSTVQYNCLVSGMQGTEGGTGRPTQEENGVVRDSDEANHHQGRSFEKGDVGNLHKSHSQESL